MNQTRGADLTAPRSVSMDFLDGDRFISANVAWNAARREANRLGLRVVQPPPPANEALFKSHVVPTSLWFEDTKVSQSTGKGLGIQAWASGLFEAFEHGAATYSLPNQTSPVVSRTLNSSRLEESDLRYRFAVSKRRTRPQPTVEFENVTTGERILYPAVAADFGYQILDQDFDLLYLDRTCTTKGYAAGHTIADAQIHALNELIEHDALSAFMLSPVISSCAPIDISVEGFAPATNVIRILKSSGASDIAIVRLPSIASTVIYVWLRAPSGSILTGIGCSSNPMVALLRALTESHQELVADQKGITFLDEGGVSLSNLDRYPVLRSLAIPMRPQSAGRVHIMDLALQEAGRPQDPSGKLQENGIDCLRRVIFETSSVVVIQVLTPQLERFAELVFGRPIVPTGRLASPGLVKILTAKEIE